jgi:hypothetical protein
MSVPAEAGPVPAGAVPADADVIVLRRRPGPALSPGDLVAERRPLHEPGPGEVVVRNLVTTVDPYQLRAVVSEFDGLGRAPEALATVFDRGSPHIGRRVVRIAR